VAIHAVAGAAFQVVVGSMEAALLDAIGGTIRRLADNKEHFI